MKKGRKIYSYSVFYQLDPDGGYVAYVPGLPGCHSQGETFEEAEKNITEAIEVYLRSLIRHGEKIPEEKKSLGGLVKVLMPSAV